ncbi:VOC family protein (plasmid) [Streptosporangium sp. CA-135522]|uniref:VOC family protein n=1 Tax=Streptosporangium sp. CA-135522 TaxID=3240072 RepID=UPI003D8EA712
MAQPAIVGIFASNIEATLRFYALLGLTFAEEDPQHRHLRSPNGTQIMINDDRLAPRMGIREALGASGRLSLGIRCDTPAELDELYERCADAGFGAVAPYDAPWGQRYAILRDPDGSRVELYALLPGVDGH